jgi:gliding motility-associated-like protein
VNSNLGSASIVINPIPNAPDVSDNSTYCLNYIPDTLFALGNSNALIFWYEEPSLQNVIQTGSFYYPENWLGETVYYVVQEENGCVSVPIEISITFENCDITIPTAFTPDNDLVNDVWVLDDIDAIYPKNRVSIYNRWGNLIYQSAQGSYESDPWNGKYKNEVMPVGSYYFIIEFNDESNDGVSGTVTIIK